MLTKKRISNRKIGEIHNYNSINPHKQNNNLLKVFLVILCIVVVGFFGKYILYGANIIGQQIGKGTVGIVSSMGQQMKKDEFGNVNIMVVGYGGEGHQGGYLADSIMVASRNPKLGVVTMLSVPRDLWVYNKQENLHGRINQVFSHAVGRKLEFATGARALADQLQDIMGVTIPYYALIDFKGFASLIDTLGGVDIDVPKTIHDSTYPDGKMGYLTFHVNSGVNHFDGNTALMYARSRHSTSDFSRSLRQQQIIKAIMSKLVSTENFLSPSKIKQLHSDYTKIVKTNIQNDEIIGMSKAALNLKDIFSYGYTTECSNTAWKFSNPACFLTTPNRDLFGGASVMIPIGATPANVTFYDYTKKFAFYVLHNQEYLKEKANIVIQNGIDKNYAKQLKKKTNGYANQIAAKLKKFAFNVSSVENSTQPSNTGTIVYFVGTGEYDKTADMLKYFLPIDQVVKYEATSGTQLTNVTGADMVIVLGNSYVDTFDSATFSYYK